MAGTAIGQTRIGHLIRTNKKPTIRFSKDWADPRDRDDARPSVPTSRIAAAGRRPLAGRPARSHASFAARNPPADPGTRPPHRDEVLIVPRTGHVTCDARRTPPAP